MTTRGQQHGGLTLTLTLPRWLHEAYGTVVELYFAHGLCQSPLTAKSTGFDVHQDTEDFPFIEYTVVVKLTADPYPSSEPHSAMRLVGAPRTFEYAAPAGSAGVFRARVFHASVSTDTSETTPTPTRPNPYPTATPTPTPNPNPTPNQVSTDTSEHLKLAFFFRASLKGERRGMVNVPRWQRPSSAPAPLGARPVALGSSPLPGRGRAISCPATASAARARHLQSRRSHRL